MGFRVGRDLGRWGLTFEGGAGPSRGDILEWGRTSAYNLPGRERQYLFLSLEVGPWVGGWGGLGSARQEGGSEGRGLGLGA